MTYNETALLRQIYEILSVNDRYQRNCCKFLQYSQNYDGNIFTIVKYLFWYYDFHKNSIANFSVFLIFCYSCTIYGRIQTYLFTSQYYLLTSSLSTFDSLNILTSVQIKN